DQGHGGVLEIPLQWRDGFGQVGETATGRDDTIFLYYATRHHHPIVNGMVARLPRRRLAQLSAVAAFRQVLSLQHEPGFADAPAFGVDDLRGLGIGYVVYHRDRPEAD